MEQKTTTEAAVQRLIQLARSLTGGWAATSTDRRLHKVWRVNQPTRNRHHQQQCAGLAQSLGRAARHPVITYCRKYGIAQAQAADKSRRGRQHFIVVFVSRSASIDTYAFQVVQICPWSGFARCHSWHRCTKGRQPQSRRRPITQWRFCLLYTSPSPRDRG